MRSQYHEKILNPRTSTPLSTASFDALNRSPEQEDENWETHISPINGTCGLILQSEVLQQFSLLRALCHDALPLHNINRTTKVEFCTTTCITLKTIHPH